MTADDPIGRAMLDYQRGEYEEGDCVYVDGAETHPAMVEQNYFGDPENVDEVTRRRYEFVEGPVVDVGCGAGRDALWLQERHETLAVDVNPECVEAARERGVENTDVMDMFDLDAEADAFRTVHAVGTQAGLARSLVGLGALLAEFARVTDDRGRASVDMLDPTVDGFEDAFGYRPDPRPGFAWRTFHFRYGDLVGPTLAFLLMSPERFREAVAATEWSVRDVLRKEDSSHYHVLLAK